jgi:HD-like signal output (HDOD) protein
MAERERSAVTVNEGPSRFWRANTPKEPYRFEMHAPFDLDAEVVRLIKGKLIELPTYPGVALQLQRVISSDNYGLDDLVRLVESDAALASHVLRAANSAFFHATTPVAALPQAISRVGAAALSNIAIAGTLGVQASIDGPLAAMRRDSWRRSLVGASMSQSLARSRKVDPGEAFLAGLLHDFGETIAFRTFEVILEQRPDVEPLNAAQWLWHAQRYHVELGMALAADWKLPQLLVESVMRHHDGDTSFCDFPRLVELVALTDDVATRLFDAPSLEAADLPQVKGLTASEHETLAHLVPRLASLLQSLDVPAQRNPAVASLVKPEAPLVVTPGTQKLDYGVKVLKKDQADIYRALALSPRGLKIKGSTPQAERHLITVEIERLSFPATVHSCSAADDGCVIELKPFALSGETAMRFNQLVKSAPPALAA